MNAPNPAWNAVWTRKRTTRRRVACDQVIRPTPPPAGSRTALSAVATVASVSDVPTGASAGGFGRNSDAIAATVLVPATTRNGRRRSDTPTSSPPTVGPNTEPAEPIADRTLFA